MGASEEEVVPSAECFTELKGGEDMDHHQLWQEGFQWGDRVKENLVKVGRKKTCKCRQQMRTLVST